MKLKVKTLKGVLFEVEVSDDQATVRDAKDAIAAQKPDMPPDLVKLIHAGQIWKDETKLSECGYKEEDFIVVMVAKAKAPPPPTQQATPASEATTTAPPSSTPSAVATPGPAEATTNSNSGGAGADATAAANSQVVNGAGAEATIAQLCDMGFARPEVEHCLRAAFGNPDRAVEYLMTGIPEGLQQGRAEAGGEPAQQGGQNDEASPLTNMIAGNEGGVHPDVATAVIPPELEQLRSNPQLGQLAAVILQNPEAAQSLLPALAQSHPQLAGAVQAHPAAFARLLMEASGQTGGGGGGGGDPAAPPGTVVVRLSEEDRAVVERLSSMGFERNLAVQAYLACEKNEELALNFLLDNMGD